MSSLKKSLLTSISTSTGRISAAVDLFGKTLTAIQMSTAWTNADITFEGSVPNSTAFHPLYGSTGNLITLASTANRIIAVNPDDFRGLREIKLRSSATQTASRALRLSVDSLSAIK